MPTSDRVIADAGPALQARVAEKEPVREKTFSGDGLVEEKAATDEKMIKSDTPPEMLTAAEPPPLFHAQLKIESEPNGADVYLNGEIKGRTPLETDVNDGIHSLRLSLKGYYDWESNLLVEDEIGIPIRIPLLKK